MKDCLVITSKYPQTKQPDDEKFKKAIEDLGEHIVKLKNEFGSKFQYANQRTTLTSDKLYICEPKKTRTINGVRVKSLKISVPKIDLTEVDLSFLGNRNEMSRICRSESTVSCNSTETSSGYSSLSSSVAEKSLSETSSHSNITETESSASDTPTTTIEVAQESDDTVNEHISEPETPIDPPKTRNVIIANSDGKEQTISIPLNDDPEKALKRNRARKTHPVTGDKVCN